MRLKVVSFLRLHSSLVLLGAVACLFRCGGDEFSAPTPSDSGSESSADVADAALDPSVVIICSACADQPTDAADAGDDAVESSTSDSTEDSAPDSGDAGTDGPIDSGQDAEAMISVDAGPEAGADADSDGGCNAGQPFGSPVAVPGINTTFNDYTMRLSPDETIAFFTSDRPFDAAPISGLFQASRGTTAAPFGTAIPVSGVTGNFADPSPTGDLLTLFFNVNGGTAVIYSASRAGTGNTFGNQGQVANVHGSGNDYTSYILPGGTALYFSSDRPGGMGAGDIWRSSGSGPDSLGAPVDVSGINSSADEWSIAVTPDDLTIYFGSTRTDGAAKGGYDVWTATRSSPSASFSAPTIIAAVNSPQDDVPTWISPDNCRLYLSSKRAGGMGGFDVYVTARGP